MLARGNPAYPIASEVQPPSGFRTAGTGGHCGPSGHATARPVILNLGCGAKTSAACINIDWSAYAVLRRNRWLLPLATAIIGRERAERVRAMQGKVICHDMRKGIPLPDASADAAYHSHLMEHIDRDHVGAFQKEIFRVLKPGGIQRICVPDLEHLIREYGRSLEGDDGSKEHSSRHDATVAGILEQCVRRIPAGARRKSSTRQRFETAILGDARARGETHQWMWDRVNIRAVLTEAGFVDIAARSWDVSSIENWADTGLERASDGSEYKPNSLYVECRKPSIDTRS